MKKAPIPILKSDTLQQQLDENGFILVDFLDAGELTDLSSLFDDHHLNNLDIPMDVLFTGLHNPDLDYRMKMHGEISAIVTPKLQSIFSNIQTTTFTFQIKGIGPNSELGVHQDWSFSREYLGYRTYTFWVPLVDSTDSNGTLSIIPRSHLDYDCVRGARINTHITDRENDFRSIAKTINIKAGQLMLFDSALIHFSTANLSDKIRVSVMTNIIGEDAQLYLYFPSENDDTMITEYEVPSNFFLMYSDYKQEYFAAPSFAKKIRDFDNAVLLQDRYQIQQTSKSMLTRIKDWFTAK